MGLTNSLRLLLQGGLLAGALVCLLVAGLASAQDTTQPEAVSTTQPIASVNVTANATKAGNGVTGDELKKQLDDNSEAQEYKEGTKPIKAQIVKQEEAATLESGTGDVSTTCESLCDLHPAGAKLAPWRASPCQACSGVPVMYGAYLHSCSCTVR